MKFAHKLMIGALSAVLCMGASAADTNSATEPQLSDKDKAALGICNIVSEGVFHIAAMRQEEVKESEAKKNLEDASQDLVKQFGDDDITKFIREFWQIALTDLYEQKVEKSDDDKREFVHGATSDAGYICLDILLNDN